MSLITIDDFISRITGSKRYLEEASSEALYRVEESPQFVKPFLKSIKENSSPIFSIVSAPGAVGKTTFAKYTSATKLCCYWDLSKIKLGDNTFIGTIAKVFGTGQLSSFLNDFKKGDVTLVLDAFDEAEIISGWEGVEKFIHEIYQHCSSSSKMNVIFFARSETASMLALLLDTLGDGKDLYTMYEIDYFDKIGAYTFIKKYLANLNDTNFEKHPVPFEGALEAIFNTIGKGLNKDEKDIWDNREIRSFIGYSPVLQTISSFILKQNLSEIANTFIDQNSEFQGIIVINQFINQLLLREQTKVVNAVKQRVKSTPAGWSNWDSIYSPGSQIKYVLNYINSGITSDDILLTEEIPDWMEKDYVDSVIEFIGNHPFIRSKKFNSPAFRDYTLGNLVNDRDYESRCLQFIMQGSFALTPLFSFFYAHANDNKCLGTHARFIYESVSARKGYENNILMTFVKPENGNYSFNIIGSEDDSYEITLECIIDENTPLVFDRRLHNATINIAHELILGPKNGSIELSEVDITASKLTITAHECIVNCHDEKTSRIVSDTFRQDDYSLTVSVRGDGKQFQINWPNGRKHPWTDYYIDYNRQHSADYNEEIYALKRIMIPFRKHGREGYSKHKDYIDRRIVSDSVIRKNMLEFLKRKEIISVRTDINQYVITDESLNKCGLHWSVMKNLDINPSILSLLQEFKAGNTVEA